MVGPRRTGFDSGEHELTIDEILHVARIEVDETGTTAAAATSIGIVVTSISEPEVVNVDSPFFYFIRDRVLRCDLVHRTRRRPDDHGRLSESANQEASMISVNREAMKTVRLILDEADALGVTVERPRQRRDR